MSTPPNAVERVRENSETLVFLANSDLNSAKWARELLEAADVNYKCPNCNGYLQPTDRDRTFRCGACGRSTSEAGGDA